MMPDDLLKPLSPAEVRSLVAYLAGPRPGADAGHGRQREELFQRQRPDRLARQHRRCGASRTARSSAARRGLKQNEFLKSDLVVGDFRLRVQVNLVDNQGNSGIQFRSEPIGRRTGERLPGRHRRGLVGQALRRARPRAVVAQKSGEAHVKPGWNTYEIAGQAAVNIRTWINGQLCVDLDDPAGASAASSPCSSTPAARPKCATRILKSNSIPRSQGAMARLAWPCLAFIACPREREHGTRRDTNSTLLSPRLRRGLLVWRASDFPPFGTVSEAILRAEPGS